MQISRFCALLRYVDQLIKHRKIWVFFLATPSNSALEASVIRMQNEEEHVILKCSTMRSKPPPQITWLLGKDIEVYGEWRKGSLSSFVFLPKFPRDFLMFCHPLVASRCQKILLNNYQVFSRQMFLITNQHYVLVLKG